MNLSNLGIRKYEIKAVFITEVLGTTPTSKTVYSDYIASELHEEDAETELETVEDTGEKGHTTFRVLDDGTPVLASYVVLGAMKSAIYALRKVKKADGKKTACAKLTAYKPLVAQNVFVYRPGPDKDVLLAGEDGQLLRLEVPEGQEWGVNQRPLRAVTAQGPRVALASSDTLPPGTSFTFQLWVMSDKISQEVLEEIVAYWSLHGFGAWRNAGYGRVMCEMKEISSDYYEGAANE